jgi:D-alanine transaminase
MDVESEGIVYLNGRFVPRGEARIDPEDRGFLFGDGVYEVLRVRASQPLFVDRHHARLTRSAAQCEIAQPFDRAGLEALARELVARNGISDGIVYLQVTRGVASRAHVFPPPGTAPTVYAFARATAEDPELWARGVSAILLPDERWGRVDMKTVNLLPNVLAAEKARRAGAYEAILVREGVVTEGSHCNAWIVRQGVALTHPTGPRILAGVTRDTVLRAAARVGVTVEERPFTAEELLGADEVFLTGTTTGVLGVVRVDGTTVGDGRPGPVTRALDGGYRTLVEEEVARARAAVAS